MKFAFSRTGAILAALAVGALMPQAHILSGAIRWLIMTMLFFVFLQTRLERSALRPSHGLLLLANLAMGFVGWGLGTLVGGRDIGLSLFFVGITPTAAAAPVIISFLRGRVDYVVAAFGVTNLGIAVLLPFVLPLALGRPTPDAFAAVAGTLGLVMAVPFVLAWTLRRFHPEAAAWPGKLRNLSFGIWLTTMTLVTANASHFLRSQTGTSPLVVLEIAGLALVLCAANFALGRAIGGRTFAREASQALGQKNTALTVYLALAYASPLVALGPTAYILWHNLWNSWQLHRLMRAPPPP
jgi:bile acid:Na+ symporter, BASS family